MTPPKKNPVTLRFEDEELEQRFLDDYVEKSHRTVYVGLLAGAVIYGLIFGFMDWLQGTNALAVIWSIRAAVCLLALAVYRMVGMPAFTRYMQEILSALIFVAGVGLLAMILLDTSPDAYLDGPVLVVLPAYVLFRLRFVYATVVGLALFVLYGPVIYFSEGMRATELWASAVFLFAANLIGMVAGYTLESYARKEFWQTLIIDRERQTNARLLDVKNRFFANISHEIRTPLTLILGPLDDLLAGSDRAEVAVAQRLLASMQRSGRRLLKFIDQLLELSRLDVETSTMKYRSGDIGQFIEREIAAFQPYAESSGVNLQIEKAGAPDDAPPIPFTTDYDRLEIVLFNLISNALKYTRAGGQVKVRLERDPERPGIILEVRDNGPGIPKDEIPYIFDRFYRVSGATTHGEGGLGLGLTLTRTIVEQLEGRIDVQSEVGFGARFIVAIPDKRDEAIHAEPLELFEPVRPVEMDIEPADRGEDEAVFGMGAEMVSEGDASASMVLVIDDHAEVRSYIRECLETDHTVLEAAGGEEGLELATRHIPDLVVVDLMMPGMDGHAFVRHMRESMLLSHIPVIMLTASTSEHEKMKSLEEGVDDYMTKPFNRRELLARIENLIAQRNRLRAKYSLDLVTGLDVEEIVSAEAAFLNRLREIVFANIGDEHFNGETLADEMGVSLRQLQRKTRAITGETPTSFIRIMRLQRARQLIEADFGSVAEVAYAVGFGNPTYFTRCFRERFGKAPTEWKEGAGER